MTIRYFVKLRFLVGVLNFLPIVLRWKGWYDTCITSQLAYGLYGLYGLLVSLSMHMPAGRTQALFLLTRRIVMNIEHFCFL
jgi:hypothetical protein